MSRTAWAVAALIALSGIALALSARHPPGPPLARPGAAGPALVDPIPSPLAEERHEDQVAAFIARADHAEDALRWQEDPRLAAPTRALVRAAMCDRRVALVVRNNLANALNQQDEVDPEAPSLFLAMLNDPTESAAWREFCVQHLASALPRTPQRTMAEQALVAIVIQGPFSATAALHVDRLADDGVLERPAAFAVRLAAIAGDTAAPVADRVTALALLGRRRCSAQAETVRACARDSQPLVMRSALAALGDLGDETDAALLGSRTGDPDPLTAAVAASALRRLDRPR